MQRRSTPRFAHVGAIALSACVVLGACGKTPTPEVQVRTTLAQAQTAAEKKDIAGLRDLISGTYRDAEGQDKRGVEALLRYYFLRHESIHLFTRVPAVNVSRPDAAEAVVLVAMAARPVRDAHELDGLRADLYRFDITLSKEGDHWRVLRAAWRPV